MRQKKIAAKKRSTTLWRYSVTKIKNPLWLPTAALSASGVSVGVDYSLSACHYKLHCVYSFFAVYYITVSVLCQVFLKNLRTFSQICIFCIIFNKILLSKQIYPVFYGYHACADFIWIFLYLFMDFLIGFRRIKYRFYMRFICGYDWILRNFNVYNPT